MYQIKGPECVIECWRAVLGSAGGVGQGVRVDSWLRSIIVDVGGESSLLGVLAASMSLLATTLSVASQSLGRSISARTTVGPTLLLLGELGVSWLALHSAKLIGLGALTTSAGGCTFLLKRECGGLNDPIWLEIFDLIGQHLTENLSYNLHSRRELAKDDHGLHWGRELEAGILEVCEVAEQLRNHRSGMGASRDVGGEEPTKLSIGRADTGGAKVLLKVVPDLLDGSQVRDSDLDRGGEAQGDVTKRSLGTVIPVLSVIMVISGLSGRVNEPLALGLKVGLHGGMPLLSVGASEEGNHLVKSAGHGEFCWESMESASECDNRQARKEETPEC